MSKNKSLLYPHFFFHSQCDYLQDATWWEPPFYHLSLLSYLSSSTIITIYKLPYGTLPYVYITYSIVFLPFSLASPCLFFRKRFFYIFIDNFSFDDSKKFWITWKKIASCLMIHFLINLLRCWTTQLPEHIITKPQLITLSSQATITDFIPIHNFSFFG